MTLDEAPAIRRQPVVARAFALRVPDRAGTPVRAAIVVIESLGTGPWRGIEEAARGTQAQAARQAAVLRQLTAAMV